MGIKNYISFFLDSLLYFSASMDYTRSLPDLVWRVNSSQTSLPDFNQENALPSSCSSTVASHLSHYEIEPDSNCFTVKYLADLYGFGNEAIETRIYLRQHMRMDGQ